MILWSALFSFPLIWLMASFSPCHSRFKSLQSVSNILAQFFFISIIIIGMTLRIQYVTFHPSITLLSFSLSLSLSLSLLFPSILPLSHLPPIFPLSHLSPILPLSLTFLPPILSLSLSLMSFLLSCCSNPDHVDASHFKMEFMQHCSRES